MKAISGEAHAARPYSLQARRELSIFFLDRGFVCSKVTHDAIVRLCLARKCAGA